MTVKTEKQRPVLLHCTAERTLKNKNGIVSQTRKKNHGSNTSD